MQKFKGSHHGCPPFMEDTDEIRFSPWFTRSTTKENTAPLETTGRERPWSFQFRLPRCLERSLKGRSHLSISVALHRMAAVRTKYYSGCFSSVVEDPGDCSGSRWRRHEPLALNGISDSRGPCRTASVGKYAKIPQSFRLLVCGWQMMSTGALHFPSLKAFGVNNMHV